MKIGYYFPRKSEISNNFHDKSDSSLIEWDSDLGYDFILSLVNNNNIDLPSYNKSHDFSFSSLENFQEFISVLKSIRTLSNIENNICSDWPDNIIPSLKRVEKLNNNNIVLKDQINNLIESFSENSSVIQKEIKNLTQELNKLANLKEDESFAIFDFMPCYILRKILKKGFDNPVEIPVRGFRLSNILYNKSELKKAGIYLKENSRISHIECLNNFYQVIRTNKNEDILYLSLERSTKRGFVQLVFRSNPIKRINTYTHDTSDILNSKNDFVYFYKFIEKRNELFLCATNKALVQNSSKVQTDQIYYGMMEVLDKNGKSLDAENNIRDHITITLRKGDILEGLKMKYDFKWPTKDGSKKEIYGIEVGFCGDICNSCEKAPCICQRIIDWETYIHEGFKPDDDPGMFIPPPSLYEHFNMSDDYGLNWRNYNDQLDMDQQGQEFWDSNY